MNQKWRSQNHLLQSRYQQYRQKQLQHSFTAVTLIVDVTVMEFAALSLTVKLTVRAAVDGFSELLEYCTARNAVCHCAKVAVLPAEDKLSTPVNAL